MVLDFSGRILPRDYRFIAKKLGMESFNLYKTRKRYNGVETIYFEVRNTMNYNKSY